MICVTCQPFVDQGALTTSECALEQRGYRPQHRGLPLVLRAWMCYGFAHKKIKVQVNFHHCPMWPMFLSLPTPWWPVRDMSLNSFLRLLWLSWRLLCFRFSQLIFCPLTAGWRSGNGDINFFWRLGAIQSGMDGQRSIKMLSILTRKGRCVLVWGRTLWIH